MTVLAMDEGSRESLVNRLFRAFSVQVSQIEERVRGHGVDEIVEDTKVLGALAKTLETLVGVERKLINEDPDNPVYYDALRTELMSQLKGLKLGPAPEGEESAGGIDGGAANGDAAAQDRG
ncbi:MAG: hypothetical protein AAGF49_08260 [Pseudomonadota bacterium]